MTAYMKASLARLHARQPTFDLSPHCLYIYAGRLPEGCFLKVRRLLAMAVGILGWLMVQEKHKKHIGWSHPVTVSIMVLISVVGAMLWLSDLITAPRCSTSADAMSTATARFYAMMLGTYVAALLVIRLVTMGSSALYEFLWACNVSMVLATISLATCRPVLTGAVVIAVAIDQMMWYVDVAAWVLTGRFPIGVAKYLTWPETSWARRLTSTHHVWFMPFCIAVMREPIPLMSYPLSGAYVAILDCLCRCVTPFSVPMSPPKAGSQNGEAEKLDVEGPQQRYLNVNLVYELWKDIKFSWLQHSHPSASVHLSRLVVLWTLLNLPFALLLIPISNYMHPVGAAATSQAHQL